MNEQHNQHCMFLLGGHRWRIKFVFQAAMSLENDCGCFPGQNFVLDIKAVNWDAYVDVATRITEAEEQLAGIRAFLDHVQPGQQQHENRTLH